MTALTPLAIEELTWQQAEPLMRGVNSELANLIGEIAPGPECKLYRVKYRYGDNIVKNELLQLPTLDGGLVPAVPGVISTEIYENIGNFVGMPPGLILNNTIELFLQSTENPIPVMVKGKGELFGLWRIFRENKRNWHMTSVWHITAGSRSLIMLPKLTDTASLLRLRKEFGIRTTSLNNISNQWRLFTELANHPDFIEPWSVDLLFFSQKMIDHFLDAACIKIAHYLLNKCWQSSDFGRNQWIFDFFFSCMQQKRNLKPNPYLADTVKHIFAVGAGVVPGIGVATDSSTAPIKALQKIFIDVYGLKSYAPIMMHAKYFSLKEQSPVYYSLQMPTTTEFSPKSRRVLSNIMGLEEIKYIMDKFIHEIMSNPTVSQYDNCRYFADRLVLNYFHADENMRGEIVHSSELPIHDAQLSRELAYYPKRVFPENAPFWKGCIQISSKGKNDDSA